MVLENSHDSKILSEDRTANINDLGIAVNPESKEVVQNTCARDAYISQLGGDDSSDGFGTGLG